jgi:hypothetical protein
MNRTNVHGSEKAPPDSDLPECLCTYDVLIILSMDNTVQLTCAPRWLSEAYSRK